MKSKFYISLTLNNAEIVKHHTIHGLDLTAWAICIGLNDISSGREVYSYDHWIPNGQSGSIVILLHDLFKRLAQTALINFLVGIALSSCIGLRLWSAVLIQHLPIISRTDIPTHMDPTVQVYQEEDVPLRRMFCCS